MPIRIALTGEMHGPELDYIVEYFGKEENIKRVRKHILGRSNDQSCGCSDKSYFWRNRE